MADDHALGRERIEFAGHMCDAHTACIACNHVMSGMPVLRIIRHEDGDVQCLCGAQQHEVADAKVVCLHHVVDLHPDIGPAPALDIGMDAWRESVEAPWITDTYVEPTEDDGPAEHD